MKSFATIVTLASLLFCLFSCDEGKSGPFTFTNTTEETVYVLIDQDGVLEKEFTAGETYQGKDYYTPQITFVKGIDTAKNKAIIDNRYTATTNNGFDYSFVKVKGTAINIIVNLEEELPDELTGCYLAETQGKLGDYSNPDIMLTNGMSSPDSKQLYTDSPVFKIYNNAKQDVTDLFTIAVGKESFPTVQWNLGITYPKGEVVQN